MHFESFANVNGPKNKNKQIKLLNKTITKEGGEKLINCNESGEWLSNAEGCRNNFKCNRCFSKSMFNDKMFLIFLKSKLNLKKIFVYQKFLNELYEIKSS